MDELTKAIIAAGDELTKKHDWSVDDNGNGCSAEPDGKFCTVLRKHLLPLVNVSAFKTAKIQALRAELAALESS